MCVKIYKNMYIYKHENMQICWNACIIKFVWNHKKVYKKPKKLKYVKYKKYLNGKIC